MQRENDTLVLYTPASIQLPPACGTTVRFSYALDDLRRNLPH